MHPNQKNVIENEIARRWNNRIVYINPETIPPKKREESEALQREIDAFLANGGQITVIPPGHSKETIKLNKKQRKYFSKRPAYERE